MARLDPKSFDVRPLNRCFSELSTSGFHQIDPGGRDGGDQRHDIGEHRQRLVRMAALNREKHLDVACWGIYAKGKDTSPISQQPGSRGDKTQRWFQITAKEVNARGRRTGPQSGGAGTLSPGFWSWDATRGSRHRC